jgi:hypothetical protein
MHGQKEDFRPGSHPDQAVGCFNSIHDGHGNVHYYNIRAFSNCGFDGVQAVGDCPDELADILKDLGNLSWDRRMIVDE